MNYVAHAFLAPSSPPIALLGNLLGDFVKGPLPGVLDPDLARAVAEHRAVDAFCDRHPAFRASRRRLFEGFSHYAGVIVDVLFDHLLCEDWERFSDRGFDEFVDSVYAAIEEHGPALPDELWAHAERIARLDVLRRYRRVVDVRVALERLSSRTRRPVELAASVDLFIARRPDFVGDFRSLFADLLAEAGEPPRAGRIMERR